MPNRCATCGKEIPAGKEIKRKDQFYCSVEHARSKAPASAGLVSPTSQAAPNQSEEIT
jgi:hypothetical protein